jgi:hypothetical protein
MDTAPQPINKTLTTRIEAIDIVIAVYVITIMAIIAISYGNVLPQEITRYLSDSIPGVSGHIIPVDAKYVATVIELSNITMSLSIVFTIVAGIFLVRSRNIFEMLAIFVASMLPRERKFWGVVFDENNQQAIPFSTIRVVRKEVPNHPQVILQTVTDLDGRYRLNLRERLGNLYLEVQAPSYQIVQKEINFLNVLTSGNEVIDDIGLVRQAASPNIWKERFYSLRPKMYVFLKWVVYLSALTGFPFAFFVFLNNPVVINFIFLTVMIVSAIWNTMVIRDRHNPDAGKILTANRKSIASAQVELFDNHRKLTSATTDANGIPQFTIPSGVYLIKVSLVTGKQIITTSLVPVKVTNQGYLSNHIVLDLADLSKVPLQQALLNPFS